MSELWFKVVLIFSILHLWIVWGIPEVPFSVLGQELEVLQLHLSLLTVCHFSLPHPLSSQRKSVEKWRKNQIHPLDHCAVFPASFHGNVKFWLLESFKLLREEVLGFPLIHCLCWVLSFSCVPEVHLSVLGYRSVGVETIMGAKKAG